jgi:hypothetical protein
VVRLAQAAYVVEGANLVRNEYGSKLFADFFFITGFHGFCFFGCNYKYYYIFLMYFLELTRKEEL